LTSSSATTIELEIGTSLDNGGSPITKYKLYIDSGTLTSSFTYVSNYLGLTTTYTVTDTYEYIVSGYKYRFILTAINAIGESSSSAEVRFAAADLPATPQTLIRSSSSTETSIILEWDVEPDTETPITGYALEWDSTGDGVFYEIWNGRGRPDILTYTVSVTTGELYYFRHRSYNFNGPSADYSPLLSHSYGMLLQTMEDVLLLSIRPT
jgi:hypothetical protein